MSDAHPELQALQRRLEDEERAYSVLLAAVDRLAALPQPAQGMPDLPAQLARLNAAWDLPRGDQGGGLTAAARRKQWEWLAPVFDRQREFNAVAVQILNGYIERTGALHDQLAQLASSLVQYLQRLLPVMDARDRVSSALATTRSELILEAFDRRQESMARRLDGLLALRDRLETLSEEMRAVRATLAADAPSPTTGAAAARAAEAASSVAFENVFRGEPADLRERLADYVEMFVGSEPVVDLGCGRGEFLELLRERGLSGRGVEQNADAAALCRGKGLDVTEADLVDFLRSLPPQSVGGVFAAQVAEHLPPRALLDAIHEAHRALRPGGVMVLETVNPRSVFAYHEVYLRDLTHERALHPETLRFVAAAQGFTDVRVELRSPVEASGRLAPVPADGLPPRAAEVLNENLARLNDLLYGPMEYALIARR